MSSKLYAYAILMLLMTSAVFAQIEIGSGYPQYCGYGYFSYAYSYYCPDYDDEDDSSPKDPLDVGLDPDCDGSVITVTSDGDAVPGADVDVVSVAGPSVFSGTTNSNGQVTLGKSACGMNVRIYADKTGYEDYNGDPVEIDCGSCTEENVTPGCTSDNDCLSNQKCVSGECVAVSCECGQIVNHACEPYTCCTDAQCGANEVCANHACQQRLPTYECTSDEQCAPTAFCDMPAGASGGSCKDVPLGDCGEVRDHAFVAYGYECGNESGCPSCQQGYSCLNHQCVPSDLTCPTTGIVGDTKTCMVQLPCADCGFDVVITDPAGKNSTGRTGEGGSLPLALNQQGTYKVALMKDGQVVKIIEVRALPQAQPEEPEKPVAVGPDLGMIFALLVLLLLVVLAILYMRGRGGKK